ncbi:hypothetical protein MXB_1171 [Myxobolus squamalis]|nr:hypothetical protein MXB_1171 [Myxobolus squamalis]
MSFSSQHNRKL